MIRAKATGLAGVLPALPGFVLPSQSQALAAEPFKTLSEVRKRGDRSAFPRDFLKEGPCPCRNTAALTLPYAAREEPGAEE